MDAFVTNRGMKIILGSALADSGTPANWKMALCTAKDSQNLDTDAAVNKGGGKVGIQLDAHGFSVGSRVVIEGTTNYDGAYLVDEDTTTNEIVIVATYAAETPDGSETVHESPSFDTNTLSDLDEIAVGNGYNAGGATVARDVTTGFNAPAEDDDDDFANIQLQNVTFTASGTIPSSGAGARYAVLTDASGNVIVWWDLGSDNSVSHSQTLQIQSAEIKMEPAV